MRIVFLGTGSFGCPALRALRDAGHEIVAAISQPDRPAGRGRQVRPSHVHALADELGVPHVQTADVNALSPQEVAAGAELAFVAAFGQKIGPAWLTAFEHGMINAHASLLPKYRGAAPFQWAIINGERETGVTIFRLDERWDAGPILGVRATPIGELETAGELHDRLALLAAELAVEVVAGLERGTLVPIPQDGAQATRAPKLTKADGVVDFTRDAFAVQRRIHGLWPWPAATCRLVQGEQAVAEPPVGRGAAGAGGSTQRAGATLQLARAERVDNDTLPSPAYPPGALHPDLAVQTGRGRLRLLEVKPAGGRLMPFADYARGRRMATPARLLSETEADRGAPV